MAVSHRPLPTGAGKASSPPLWATAAASSSRSARTVTLLVVIRDRLSRSRRPSEQAASWFSW